MRTRPSSRRAVVVAVVAIVAVGGASLAVAATRRSTDAPPVPRFVDDTAGSGIDHRYQGGYEFFVGGGVAAFDCDGDGRQDLYVAGGSGPAGLYRNRSEQAGALRFDHVTSATTDLTGVTGAYPIDVDSDGTADLVVLRDGPDVVLRGTGGCAFERADERLGIDADDARTVGFSATWEAANALPTLAFGDYLTADRQGCEDGRLLRPDASGTTYSPAVPLAPSYCTLSMLFSDWHRTGERDLRVSNDRNYYRDGSEQLWRIRPGEAPTQYGEADGWRPLQIWGMGIASRDLDGDGIPEVFLTSQGDNKLQHLVAGATGPTYEDVALDAGVTAHRPYTGGDILPSTAWHPEFADVDNDGRADLFVSKGNVEAQADYASKDPNDLLLARDDGTFVEAGEEAGIADFRRARGAALVDLNADGLLDLVVVNREEPVTLWRNVGGGDASSAVPLGNWIAVRLRQPAPNVDAIGAWVDVRTPAGTQSVEVTVGGGHAGGQLGWLHAGLGDASSAQVRVQWPDGETGPWIDVPAGSFATIERGATSATMTPPQEGP